MGYYNNKKKKLALTVITYGSRSCFGFLYHVSCVLDILQVQAVSIFKVAVYEMRSVLYRIMWSSQTKGRVGSKCLI
jgi:hypothetical protein